MDIFAKYVSALSYIVCMKLMLVRIGKRASAHLAGARASKLLLGRFWLDQ